MPDTGIPTIYRRPASPLHRHPVAGHLLTIRDAIDAKHPDAAVLEAIEALSDNPAGLDGDQIRLRAALIATAGDQAQAWLDGAAERALGEAADVAFGRAHDL